MTRVLITGASGFIGSALAQFLCERGFDVRAAYRRPPLQPPRVDYAVVGDIGPSTDWGGALAGMDAVVHAAGPAHGWFPETVLRSACAGGLERLATEALQRRVRRFILISSIKAACEQSVPGVPVSEAMPARPATRYGRAKRDAELAALKAEAANPVVLRIPLVVDARAKGNFRTLMRLADAPVPMPFAGLPAKRSILWACPEARNGSDKWVVAFDMWLLSWSPHCRPITALSDKTSIYPRFSGREPAPGSRRVWQEQRGRAPPAP